MIDTAELPDYLCARGLVPDGADVAVRALGGGISNVVLRADWEGGGVVVKQPLAQLAVEEEWEFDVARVFVERDCMAVLAEALPGSAPVVVFSDDERHLFGMSIAPEGGIVWRDEHDAGVADPARTEMAARLLAGMHASTAGDERLARRFADSWPLVQGRIDPYHRTAALAHPDLADGIEAEVQRLLATRRVLVHGDFSPKNLIAYPDRMLMLDFEVAHWGDPAFDVAFLLALVALDAMRHGDRAFVAEAERFWRMYSEGAGPVVPPDADVVAELGCIVLARIDGKSRLPWMTDEVEQRARAYARALLTDLRGTTVEEALAACP